MTAEHIAQVLRGRRRGNRYMVPCPAHDDRSPSLSISERDGRVLVHCFAGCSQADVIAALRSRGLWPERDPIPLSRADRAHRARARADAQLIRREAADFADTATIMAEWELEELSPVDPQRAVPTALLAALRISPENVYRASLERDPKRAVAMVKAGHARTRRLHVALAIWIANGMPGVAHAD
jgi:hypothetical protein